MDQHAAYAYPLSPLYPSSTHVPFFGDPTPLPFSTSGRLAPSAPIVSPPPSPSRTQVPLYEAQLARDIPLFRSTTPEHRFHPPIAASSFSHPHALATHHETPVARHATPDTIFGQPFAELASVYGDARAPLSGYFPSSPPHSMAFDSFTPRPSSPECDGLYDRFGVPVQPASFWQPGPHPPALHAVRSLASSFLRCPVGLSRSVNQYDACFFHAAHAHPRPRSLRGHPRALRRAAAAASRREAVAV